MLYLVDVSESCGTSSPGSFGIQAVKQVVCVFVAFSMNDGEMKVSQASIICYCISLSVRVISISNRQFCDIVNVWLSCLVNIFMLIYLKCLILLLDKLGFLVHAWSVS